MNYEKKYNEAFERAKQSLDKFKDKTVHWDIVRLELEDIFPELKGSEDERIRKALVRFHKSTIDIDGIKGEQIVAWLEKQGEQKPIDKVEPKFHEGDWITDGEAVFHVTSYDIDYGYQLETQKGTLFHFSDEKVENKCHLWTIQDAKDGDVLVDNYGNVVIYQEPSTNLMYHSYCYAYNKGFFDLGGSHFISNTYPATKEQRDILFAKMKEAGYEWDADKKKMKKKSQRMVSAEAKEALYDKPATIIDIDKMVLDYANTKEKGNESFGKPVNCMVRAYRQGLNDAIGKVVLKPTWSEEDDVAINRIVDCLENLNVADNDILLKDVDWLKTLKERMKGE